MKTPTDFKKERNEYLTKKQDDFLDKNMEIKTDHAYYKSLKQKLAEIESKIVPVDFSNLEFEDKIENYALRDLSPEAVAKIIEIIHEDERTRRDELMETRNDITILSDEDIDEIEKIEKSNL